VDECQKEGVGVGWVWMWWCGCRNVCAGVKKVFDECQNECVCWCGCVCGYVCVGVWAWKNWFMSVK